MPGPPFTVAFGPVEAAPRAGPRDDRRRRTVVGAGGTTLPAGPVLAPEAALAPLPEGVVKASLTNFAHAVVDRSS